jgi:hypothetical protein
MMHSGYRRDAPGVIERSQIGQFPSFVNNEISSQKDGLQPLFGVVCLRQN